VADFKMLTSVRVAIALFPVWIVLGLAISAALGGVLTGSWEGALLGLLWGGLIRAVLVHLTWSVNVVGLAGKVQLPADRADAETA
jgi:stearoyl-CoA desaturase (delta-9 desaturase)